MSDTMHVAESRIIDAPAERIYAVLRDYRRGHPAILPKAYFTQLIVEQGGEGAGTVVQAHMNVMGSKRQYHLVVSEPQPDRVLVERGVDGSIETTFTTEPVTAQQTRVTIATTTVTRAGLAGMMERLVTPPVMRKIYKAELDQIAAYMAANAP